MFSVCRSLFWVLFLLFYTECLNTSWMLSELLIRDFESGFMDWGEKEDVKRRKRQQGRKWGWWCQRNNWTDLWWLAPCVAETHVLGDSHLCYPLLTLCIRVERAVAVHGSPPLACLSLYFVLPMSGKEWQKTVNAPTLPFLLPAQSWFVHCSRVSPRLERSQLWIRMLRGHAGFLCVTTGRVPAGAFVFAGKGRGGWSLAPVLLSCMRLIYSDNNCMWLMSLPVIFVR